jgi:hypothetical protein
VLEPPNQDPDPRWIRELVVAWKNEIVLFAMTAYRFGRAPLRFGREWAGGQARAMNPLVFLASSWPLLLPVDYGLQRLLWDRGAQGDVPLALEVSRAIRPYLLVLPTSLLIFGVFRLTGSRRRLSTTLGILMYWMVFASAGWIVGLLAALAFHLGKWAPMVAGYLTMIWGAAALSGAYGFHWAWCLLALFPSCLAGFRIINALLE